MVRRDLRDVPPAPWPSVVLDSEGLWAIARNDSEDARAVLAASRAAGVPVLVPTAVLAETLAGNSRDARANQALAKIQIVQLDESIARTAARLKRLAGMTGVAATIGAIVTATSAAAGGGVILTSDSEDIRDLADCVGDGIRIRPVLI
jgi:predicted nucleic acid-binding protein